MRFKPPVVALTAVGMLALTACTGSSGGTSHDRPASGIDVNRLGDTGNGMDPTREGPVTVRGAIEGGTVHVLSSEGLNTMDPTEAYFLNTESILGGLVTRSLTQYVYDPKTGQMMLVPDLATDLGRHNKDYTEWRFTIREGVKWENGQDVTPEDVRYGILRSFDRSAFPQGPSYSNEYFLDGDSYKGPYKSGLDYRGVTVTGNTITIKMNKPFPDMPYWGAMPAMGPIPRGNDQPDKYRLHPWATGPYEFDQYTPEKSLTLVRNPQWDPTTDPGRTQYPEKYVFDFQTHSSKIDQILLADQGDGKNTVTYDNVLPEDFRTFRDQHSDRLDLGGQPCTAYWAPDYRQVRSKLVRQALAWAYPYKDAALAGGYIEGVTRVFGSNLMPPGIPGRTAYQALPGHQPGQTDTAKARALLKKAGALGYEIKWLFANDDEQQVRAKDVVAKSLEAAGFKASPVATTVADLSTQREDPNNKDINVRSATWCSDWPSGGSWFPPVLKTTNLAAEGIGSNYAVFSEPEVDKRINDVLAMPAGRQPAAWNDLDKLVAQKYFPLFVLGYGGVAMAHGSNVQNVKVDSVLGSIDWKDLWVKQ